MLQSSLPAAHVSSMLQQRLPRTLLVSRAHCWPDPFSPHACLKGMQPRTALRVVPLAACARKGSCARASRSSSALNPAAGEPPGRYRGGAPGRAVHACKQAVRCCLRAAKHAGNEASCNSSKQAFLSQRRHSTSPIDAPACNPRSGHCMSRQRRARVGALDRFHARQARMSRCQGHT